MSLPAQFSDLKGLTLKRIQATQYDDEALLDTKCGRRFRMYHDQDCCEDVLLEEVVGDLDSLLNTPILEAEEIGHAQDEVPPGCLEGENESFTWTFYKLRTLKGDVTLRWLGTSNGCYSESVDFEEVSDGEPVS